LGPSAATKAAPSPMASRSAKPQLLFMNPLFLQSQYHLDGSYSLPSLAANTREDFRRQKHFSEKNDVLWCSVSTWVKMRSLGIDVQASYLDSQAGSIGDKENSGKRKDESGVSSQTQRKQDDKAELRKGTLSLSSKALQIQAYSSEVRSDIVMAGNTSLVLAYSSEVRSDIIMAGNISLVLAYSSEVRSDIVMAGNISLVLAYSSEVRSDIVMAGNISLVLAYSSEVRSDIVMAGNMAAAGRHGDGE
ncbi:hypothetical protein STEG23_030762, partial [Scotinomys teguina]